MLAKQNVLLLAVIRSSITSKKYFADYHIVNGNTLLTIQRLSNPKWVEIKCK